MFPLVFTILTIFSFGCCSFGDEIPAPIGSSGLLKEVVHSTEFIQPVVPAYVHHGVIEPNYHVAEVIEPVPKPAPIYLRAPSPVPVAPSSYVISNEPLPFSYYNGNRINSYKAEVFPYAGVPHFYAGGPTAPVASVALPYRRKSTQAKIKST